MVDQAHTDNDSVDLPVITEAELFAEMDRLRIKPEKTPLLTDEQFKAIDYARDGEDEPVMWKRLIVWFNERYKQDMATTTLQTRYAKEKSRREKITVS